MRLHVPGPVGECIIVFVSNIKHLQQRRRLDIHIHVTLPGLI